MKGHISVAFKCHTCTAILSSCYSVFFTALIVNLCTVIYDTERLIFNVVPHCSY